LKEFAWLLAFRREGRVPRASGQQRRRVLTAPQRGYFLEWVLCLPTAPALPKGTNENFGTFSFQRQLSGKLQLAHHDYVWCRKAQWQVGK
jgi:hypothetical protein